MNKNNIADIQKEKILGRCVDLINRGYSIDYCENKFKKHRSVLKDYLPIISGLKKLRRDNLSDSFLKITLNKIYNDSGIQKIDNKNFSSIKVKSHRFPYILKPSILFISAVMFFSFSFIGVLFASQKSLPGNPLYPVKRYGENIQLLITPESKKNILHYQFLNNRLNEATLIFSFKDTEKSKIDSILKDAEEEFNQCKKYSYFGNYSEEEIRVLIEKIKEQSISLNEFDSENGGDINLKENTTDAYPGPDNKDSADSGEYENGDYLENDQGLEETEKTYDPDISENKDDPAVDDEKESDESDGPNIDDEKESDETITNIEETGSENHQETESEANTEDEKESDEYISTDD